MARNRVGTRTTMTHHLLHVRRNRLNYDNSYVRALNSSTEEISRKRNLIWRQTIFLPNARSNQQKKLRAKKISMMPYIFVRPSNCSAEEMFSKWNTRSNPHALLGFATPIRTAFSRISLSAAIQTTKRAEFDSYEMVQNFKLWLDWFVSGCCRDKCQAFCNDFKLWFDWCFCFWFVVETALQLLATISSFSFDWFWFLVYCRDRFQSLA